MCSEKGTKKMKPKYEAPPYQPKWLLQLQVFLLRHHPMGPFSKQFLVLTTTGRKTGRKHAVPLGFVRDGDTYLAINAGGRSNWYRNALANPQVTLEIAGKRIEACAEPVPVKTWQQLNPVLDVYQREQPGLLEGFFDIKPDTSQDELMQIGKWVVFMRFVPLTAQDGNRS
jgi:deazaflavin-dependent oxidoreductase (nitroreductase family)